MLTTLRRTSISQLLLAILLLFASHMSFANEPVSDPLEGYNRFMYSINRQVDRFILRPIARGYDFILPNRVQKSVTNFFDNLATIPTIINDVLQLNGPNFLNDSWRLFFNSTLGIGGLFDVASNMDLPPNKQDFGLTMARWGYENSSYFVLPILGPSTLRDTLGLPVDYYTSVYPYINDEGWRYGLLALRVVSARANLLDVDKVRAEAFDPYLFDRDAYLQHRHHLINKNKGIDAADNDPFLADDFSDEVL